MLVKSLLAGQLLGASLLAHSASLPPHIPKVTTSGLKDGRMRLNAVKITDQDSHLGNITTANGHKVLSQRAQQDPVSVGSDWYIPITIGTPPQTLYMLGDSGAPSFSVQSTLMPPAATGNSPLYDPTKSSSSALIPGYTYSECFGSGYCDNGVVYADDVTVGDLLIKGFAFEVETNNTSPSNGIRTGTMGLNFDHNGQTTSPNKIPSWFMHAKAGLEQGLWTIDYNKDTKSGEFDFGFIDSSKYTGDIGYGAVNSDGGEWTLEFTGFGNGGTYHEQSFNVLVDTGTGGGGSFPRFVLDNYFAFVPGHEWNSEWNTYQYSCSYQLVDLTIGIGDWRGTFKAEYLSEGGGTIDGGTTCISGLRAGEEPVLWGQGFIEAFFIVFDWDNARVGFANK